MSEAAAGGEAVVLLAVDAGLKTGLAAYDRQGRLRWYRSHNFGTPDRLRRGARQLLRQLPALRWVIIEGGGRLAEIWLREAEHRHLESRLLQAEEWRPRLLPSRQRRDGRAAKGSADRLARRVIAWSEAPRPTSLRHDAAEAILVGLWGTVEVGLRPDFPDLP
ncbi:MAG: hypothetical protein JRJ56_00345 [Deltaproteobacteria bacterium]|nr:hypothetical protein [Deltaproteobacteria bacterium]